MYVWLWSIPLGKSCPSRLIPTSPSLSSQFESQAPSQGSNFGTFTDRQLPGPIPLLPPSSPLLSFEPSAIPSPNGKTRGLRTESTGSQVLAFRRAAALPCQSCQNLFVSKRARVIPSKWSERPPILHSSRLDNAKLDNGNSAMGTSGQAPTKPSAGSGSYC